MLQPPETGSGPALVAPCEQANTFLRRLIHGMRCGILAIDREGSLVLCNEPAREVLELASTPRTGVGVQEALRDHPQLARILLESFSMASLPNRAEIALRCDGGGRDKTIGFTLSMVPGEDGLPIGAAVFFKDLTHVEHREEQERLRDRLVALGQMSANLAHEIRNPLASIEVSCSLLKRRLPDNEALRDLLDKIILEVRRLNRTITSSLEFVRPLTLSPTRCSLHALLEDALRVATGRRGRPALRVERLFAPAIPDFFMDRGQIRQVFENLFLNALEAMGVAGTLTVETSLAPAPRPASVPYRPPGTSEPPASSFHQHVVVRVGDTGPGIAEEHQDKLFYPFFTTKKQGSGLGLSMARKIVDSHRGLIDVESVPGKGAVFIVRLPLAGVAEDRHP